MLQNTLFEIIDQQYEGGSDFSYHIRFLEDSVIYDAHFPGRPITPGACLLEIARELLTLQIAKPIRFTEVRMIKFLNIIEPRRDANVIFHLHFKDKKERKQEIHLEIYNSEVVFTKCKLLFVVDENR